MAVFMTSQLLPRIYFTVQRFQLRVVSAAWAISTGIWLGVLSRSALDAIDDMYYLGSVGKQSSPKDFRGDEHNRRGLWEWEREVIEGYFGRKGRLAVLGAGGGREVLALKRLGFEVDGWECQEEFVSAANRVLTAEGFEPTVAVVPRDSCPPGDPSYSGIIIGWGAYTNVRGSQKRNALLRAIRERLFEGSPILLSFFSRDPAALRFHLTAKVANLVRRLARQETVELGDFLAPNYVHYFTESQLRCELEAAGLTLVMYRAQPFAHAVAIAAAGKDHQSLKDQAHLSENASVGAGDGETTKQLPRLSASIEERVFPRTSKRLKIPVAMSYPGER
jgi:hypothetical protein